MHRLKAKTCSPYLCKIAAVPSPTSSGMASISVNQERTVASGRTLHIKKPSTGRKLWMKNLLPGQALQYTLDPGTPWQSQIKLQCAKWITQKTYYKLQTGLETPWPHSFLKAKEVDQPPEALLPNALDLFAWQQQTPLPRHRHKTSQHQITSGSLPFHHQFSFPTMPKQDGPCNPAAIPDRALSCLLQPPKSPQ